MNGMVGADRFGAARAGLGRNLTHGLLDVLGRAIVRGEYDHRDLPIEEQLAQHFSVSRSVAREAVKMLAAKGLLSARPRQGTTILPPRHWNLFDPDVLRWLGDRKVSVDLLRQITEVRLAVEPAAAGLAATVGESTHLSRLDESYGRLAAAEEGGNDLLETSISFHGAVLEASGNPFYLQLRNLVTMALRMEFRFTSGWAVSNRENIHRLKMVRDAIHVGDAVKAQRVMSMVIRASESLIGEAGKIMPTSIREA